jgi:hypothetical protein
MGKNTMFKGTFYCEMLLTSYHLLDQDREKFIDSQASQLGDGPGFLILLNEDITDGFASKLKVLLVSIRCCPACHELVQYLIQKQNKEILYPGWH